MSLETASLFIAITGLCFALFIAAEKIIVRRRLKEKEIQDIKNMIRGMLTDIQITNQSLNSLLTVVSEGTTSNSMIIEMMFQKCQKLDDMINSVWSKLHAYHDEYSNRVKRNVNVIKFRFELAVTLVHNKNYAHVIGLTNEIEKQCRPFTNTQYGFVDFEKSKNGNG